MLRYVRYSTIQAVLITLFFVIASIFMIVTSIQELSSDTFDFTYLLAFPVGLWFIFLAVKPFRDYRKMMKFLRDSNIYSDAVIDFASAKSFIDDRIRLGSKYVFGKNCCAVLRYTDITKLYQHVRKRKFSEWSRELRADDVYGKTWCLCKLKPHSKLTPDRNYMQDDKLYEALSVMRTKNSAIDIEDRA